MSALKNLKVLDLSTLLPGPFATMMLADMGAEVLRIESTTRPDMTREIAPFIDGVSTKHAALNRNKRAITLDLKNPHAVELGSGVRHSGGAVPSGCNGPTWPEL